MHIALLDTEHYKRVAAGETPEAARTALYNGFRRALLLTLAPLSPEVATQAAFEDWYGEPLTLPVNPGTVYRDGSPI